MIVYATSGPSHTEQLQRTSPIHIEERTVAHGCSKQRASATGDRPEQLVRPHVVQGMAGG